MNVMNKSGLPYFLTIDILSWYNSNICLGLPVKEEGNITLRPKSLGLESPVEIASARPLYRSTLIALNIIQSLLLHFSKHIHQVLMEESATHV